MVSPQAMNPPLFLDIARWLLSLVGQLNQPTSRLTEVLHIQLVHYGYIYTVPLTSNLLLHACPLASDSKATRVRCPRYSRVNMRAHASAMYVTRVCARVTSARSTRERVSIASIPMPLPPRKKVEGLGTRLACPLRVNLVHAFERERVRVRVLACNSRVTREGCQVVRERHCR